MSYAKCFGNKSLFYVYCPYLHERGRVRGREAEGERQRETETEKDTPHPPTPHPGNRAWTPE